MIGEYIMFTKTHGVYHTIPIAKDALCSTCSDQFMALCGVQDVWISTLQADPEAPEEARRLKMGGPTWLNHR